MKKVIEKIAKFLRAVFGYGLLLTLFAGGLTLLGYIAALFIGGDIAAQICEVIYKGIWPILIKCTTGLVLLGILVMYLSGETALTAKK